MRKSGSSYTDVLRALLNSVALVGSLTALLGVSALSFIIFYYYNVPAHQVLMPVHLQFHGDAPWAKLDLPFSPNKLLTGQPYDISIDIALPDSPNNHQIGNFMVSLEFFAGVAGESDGDVPLIASSRPNILRYKSPAIHWSGTVLKAGAVLGGWTREEQHLSTRLYEGYTFDAGWRSSSHYARISLSSPELAVYSCSLRFQSRLQGLAWWLYNYRLPSFFVFSSLFWLSSVLFTIVTWFGVSMVGGRRASTLPSALSKPKIKVEDSSESSTSDDATSTSFFALDSGQRAQENLQRRASAARRHSGFTPARIVIKKEEEADDY
ncbi:hypothetical protein PYCC9005_005800 [Savitreella phatthalungensis]